jgi:hypothetical protein
MKTLKLSLTVALAAVLSVAQAAGPLLTTDKPGNPQPLRWDMSKGPVVSSDERALSTSSSHTYTPSSGRTRSPHSPSPSGAA